MPTLKNIREEQNLTQEELSSQSGISVRTIQRIEAGTVPKGYTLKALARTLGVQEKELLHEAQAVIEVTESTTVEADTDTVNYTLLKWINLSSLPFAILPPFNIIVPLILMLATRQNNALVKQLISVQIMWTIIAPILFMVVVLLKLGRASVLIIMGILILSNLIIILRNTMAIDRNRSLYFKLNFSIL